MDEKQYKRVISAYQSGEIDMSKWVLVFDNDCGYWSYRGDIPSDVSEEEEEDWLKKESEKMADKFGVPSGYEDLVDIAKAAGIEAEWC